MLTLPCLLLQASLGEFSGFRSSSSFPTAAAPADLHARVARQTATVSVDEGRLIGSTWRAAAPSLVACPPLSVCALIDGLKGAEAAC